MKPIPRPPASFLVILAIPLLLGSNSRASAQTGSLPDTTVLLRVNDRVTRVSDFTRSYFVTWPEDRPKADSTGRAEFLNRLINKELLSIAALEAGRPVGFEDRLTLRQNEQRALSNTLYQRMVLDSLVVTEADVQELRRDYSCEKRLKHIQFDDLATAEKVRNDLVAKRITWARAHRLHSKATNDSGPEGDWGWRSRSQFELEYAPIIFDHEPGEISQPYRDPSGIQIVLIAARRPATPIQLANYDHLLRKEVRNQKKAERIARIQEILLEQNGMSADDENIGWASQFFERPPPMIDSTGTFNVRRHTKVPNFAPEDTGRVLVRWRGGQLSLGSFVREYQADNALLRQPVHTPDLLMTRALTIALEPYRARMAVEKGLDQDSLVVVAKQRKLEEILVEHLYQDSIASRVFVSSAERRQYFDKHRHEYYTYPAATYGALRVASRARAESLAAVLKAGEKIENLIQADSIRYGRRMGTIRQYTTQDEGTMFYKLIMEDLKPGQTTIEPDETAGFWLIQLLAFDGSRPLSFAESEASIAESMDNLAAERLLKQFLERRRRRTRIEAHPELLARVDLTPPAAADQD